MPIINMNNISDEKQVKRKEDEFKTQNIIQREELKKLLEIKSFRDFMWRLLNESKMFETIWRQSAEIHYLAGKQDFGHHIWSELESANKEAIFQMMRENSKQEK